MSEALGTASLLTKCLKKFYFAVALILHPSKCEWDCQCVQGIQGQHRLCGEELVSLSFIASAGCSCCRFYGSLRPLGVSRVLSCSFDLRLMPEGLCLGKEWPANHHTVPLIWWRGIRTNQEINQVFIIVTETVSPLQISATVRWKHN